MRLFEGNNVVFRCDDPDKKGCLAQESGSFYDEIESYDDSLPDMEQGIAANLKAMGWFVGRNSHICPDCK
jgi:hypothetical protein